MSTETGISTYFLRPNQVRDTFDFEIGWLVIVRPPSTRRTSVTLRQWRVRWNALLLTLMCCFCCLNCGGLLRENARTMCGFALIRICASPYRNACYTQTVVPNYHGMDAKLCRLQLPWIARAPTWCGPELDKNGDETIAMCPQCDILTGISYSTVLHSGSSSMVGDNYIYIFFLVSKFFTLSEISRQYALLMRFWASALVRTCTPSVITPGSSTFRQVQLHLSTVTLVSDLDSSQLARQS